MFFFNLPLWISSSELKGELFSETPSGVHLDSFILVSSQSLIELKLDDADAAELS